MFFYVYSPCHYSKLVHYKPSTIRATKVAKLVYSGELTITSNHWTAYKRPLLDARTSPWCHLAIISIVPVALVHLLQTQALHQRFSIYQGMFRTARLSHHISLLPIKSNVMQIFCRRYLLTNLWYDLVMFSNLAWSSHHQGEVRKPFQGISMLVNTYPA